MANVKILKCDNCGTLDSDENIVMTVGVGGPRFELCAQCRIGVIQSMGISADHAIAYVASYDARKTHRGSPPVLDVPATMDQVPEGLAESIPEGLGDLSPEVDETEAAEDTESELAAVGGRRRKR